MLTAICFLHMAGSDVIAAHGGYAVIDPETGEVIPHTLTGRGRLSWRPLPLWQGVEKVRVLNSLCQLPSCQAWPLGPAELL